MKAWFLLITLQIVASAILGWPFTADLLCKYCTDTKTQNVFEENTIWFYYAESTWECDFNAPGCDLSY